MLEKYLDTLKSSFVMSSREKIYSNYKKKIKCSNINLKFLIFFDEKTKEVDKIILNDLNIKYQEGVLRMGKVLKIEDEDGVEEGTFDDVYGYKKADEEDVDEIGEDEEDHSFLDIKNSYKKILKIAQKREEYERLVKRVEEILEREYAKNEEVQIAFYYEGGKFFVSYIDVERGFATTLSYSVLVELSLVSRICFLYYSNMFEIYEKESLVTLVDSVQSCAVEDILQLAGLYEPIRVGVGETYAKGQDMRLKSKFIFFKKDSALSNSGEFDVLNSGFLNFLDLIKIIFLRKEEYKKGILEIWCDFIKYPYYNNFTFKDILELLPVYSRVDIYSSKSYINFASSLVKDFFEEYKLEFKRLWLENKSFFKKKGIDTYRIRMYKNPDNSINSIKVFLYGEDRNIIMGSMLLYIKNKDEAIILSESKGGDAESKEELLRMQIKLIKEMERKAS